MSLVKAAVGLVIGIVIVSAVQAIGPSLGYQISQSASVPVGSAYYNASQLAPTTMTSNFGLVGQIMLVASFVLILKALMSFTGVTGSSNGDY